LRSFDFTVSFGRAGKDRLAILAANAKRLQSIAAKAASRTGLKGPNISTNRQSYMAPRASAGRLVSRQAHATVPKHLELFIKP